ncbi:TetR/AcrR family transcriptional regulator [Arthrobacter sp. Br18]|uniref:TetR/AcrR family transcriptional regulator n=1 Tax=Arthrobacter sp. Br18 TaxID=1312954 RepID=UPI00047A7FF6|nr:TetR/AcrR family transcriptional regulator [Arthrobacter sp. Br18]
MGTRTRALDAAIDLVGDQGLRALTHVRVDERAGLPRGSTSNYFRTRAALLVGVVDRIVEREMSEVDGVAALGSVGGLLDALCGLVDYTTGPNRSVTAARLALFLEASHDATLREAVSRGRTAMESAMLRVLSRLGAPDPQAAADAVMACAEGLILHRIVRHVEADPRPVFSLLLRSVLDQDR